jgi:hypothetical protein
MLGLLLHGNRCPLDGSFQDDGVFMSLEVLLLSPGFK